MRHRKKLIVAALPILAGSYATICFWPHSNPEAVRALAGLREMVQQRPNAPAPAADPPNETPIDVSLVVAKLSISDATTGLYCQSGGQHQFTSGYIGDEKAMRGTLEKLCALGVLEIVSESRIQMTSGKRAKVSAGEEVPPRLLPATSGAGSTPPTAPFRAIGAEIELTPEIKANDMIGLRYECNLQIVRGKQTTTAPKRAMELNTGRVQTVLLAQLKSGETLILGGIANKCDASHFRTPLLSDLPGVGSWFCFVRERAIDEELMILVTPRIAAPLAVN